MRKPSVFLSLISVVSCVDLVAAQGAQFTIIQGAAQEANDITPDGKLVVGSGPGGGYFWRWQQDPFPVYIGGQRAVAVSDDGHVIAGKIVNAQGREEAAIWTQSTGWQGLGGLPSGPCDFILSSAYDISADGTTVVGLGWAGCSGRAFRWTRATGMVELQSLGNGNNRASVISGDGQLIAGFAQGNFNRTPGVWSPDGSGVAWNLDFQGEIHGTNEAGSTVLGTMYLGGLDGWFDAFYSDPNGANLVNLGSLHDDWAGNASAMSNAGELIAGYDLRFGARDAWIWTEVTGILSLQNTLIVLGVPNVPHLDVCAAVSADGRTIVGHTAGFPGFAWVATLPGECAGDSASLCSTAPNSVGSGALMGSNGNFSVSANALELAAGPVPDDLGIFYYGAELLNGGAGVPFGDGFRCVGGAQVYRLAPEVAAGNLLTHALDMTAPPAPSGLIEPGSTWYFQAWYRDPAGMGAGFNLSDALQIDFCE